MQQKFIPRENMKQFVILVFALFGCAFSLPKPDDSCDCGNVIGFNFIKYILIKINC